MRGDLEWGTIPRMLESSIESFGDHEALVEDHRRLSYRQLGEEVHRWAVALMGIGVEKGDRVAIWAPNIGEWIFAALGAHAAGAAIVPLNTRYKGHEAGYIIDKSKSSVLFLVTDFLDTDYVELLRQAMGGEQDGRPVGGLESLRTVIVMSGQAPTGTLSLEEFLAKGWDVDDATLRERTDSLTADDLSDILFTSGTTGRPKGAMLTHGQTLRVFADWTEIIGLREGDRYLIVNPFFHVYGYKAGFLSAFMRGATVVPQKVFEVEAAMEIVQRERITVFPGPPTIHQSILNHPDRDRYDLSTLRMCTTGAAEVPVEMLRRMRTELSYETIVTGYGLTECTGTATMCRHDDPPEVVSRTSGRPIPDVEVRVVDDEGKEVPRGEQGEILVRGYNVMLGYYDDPEETAATVDADGWLHTGDLGVMDENGYLAITGRKKDMFIVGGFNTYPAEIENAFLEHEGVAEVAVVGAPDERLGEVGMAFIIPRAGHTLDPDELKGWARQRLANYKVPRYVHIVDELPKNPIGKVLKYVLRDRARELVESGR